MIGQLDDFSCGLNLSNQHIVKQKKQGNEEIISHPGVTA
jgi:hypothetical protein